MTDAPAVAISGLGLWLPGYPSAEAWQSRTRDEGAMAPGGRDLGPRNRRRAGALGRALADAAFAAMTEAEVDPATVPMIVGSAVGEADTMIGLLDQMYRSEDPMSPAAFTMSVHNAASGLLSIATGNRGFMTSLAADHDTPASALLEGIGIVATNGLPVVVACADEAAPAHLVRDVEPWGMVAAALVLAPVDVGRPARARLQVVSGVEPTLPRAELEAPFDGNPQAGMVDLVAALLRGAHGVVRLDRGEGRGFCAVLEPVPAG